MPRIRTIKPEFFTSEDVSALPLRARLTWIGLWTHCDDHGRTKDVPRLIKAALWPLDNVDLNDVEEDLGVLAAHGRIVRYSVDGRQYLAVVNWHVHQAINRPGKPRHPAPPVQVGPGPGEDNHCKDCTPSTHGALTHDSLNPHGALTPGREQGGEQGGERAHGRGGTLTEPGGPGPEPPPRCPEHLRTRSSGPCGPCGDARREHDAWTRSLQVKPTPTITPPCPRHPDQPAGRCALCEAAAVPPPPDLRQRPRETAS